MKSKTFTGIFYGIMGGFLSFLMFFFLEIFTGFGTIESVILRGIVILSVVICFCTGKIVDTINYKK